jgi:DNA-binding response OmpR family regulator
MKKILLIEDDQIVANVYRNKLTIEGFQVEVASDGEAGYNMVHSFKPDAALLDLMLPKLPGVDLLKKIRSEPEFEKLPVIVFTSTYLSSSVQDAWKAGATKCLTKSSCTPKQVIGAVRSVLENNAGETESQKTEAPGEISETPSDAEFQAGLRKTFLEGMPATLSALRAQLQALIKVGNESARAPQIQQMYRNVRSISGGAAMAGMAQVARLAEALELLLKELGEKPENINASTLRTVASAIDFLTRLFEQGRFTATQMPPAKILVVDDEVISRRAITFALDKAKLKSVVVEDPLEALGLLREQRFDLIFLDVDMPNMSGHELCSKLRTLPAHEKTPVVFVTGLNDFESRANSMMSGGNDFIAKPFLFIELTLKALMYVMRGQSHVKK